MSCKGSIDVKLVFYQGRLYMIELKGDNHIVEIYDRDGKLEMKVYGGIVVQGYMDNEQFNTLMDVLKRYIYMRCYEEVWLEGI